MQLEGGLIQEARAVLSASLRLAGRARSEVNTSNAGASDERFRHVCASRSHPNDEVSSKLANMSTRDQLLGDLHHDAVMLLWKVELSIGLEEQYARAQRSSAKQAAALEKRRSQVPLFTL
jgi:hypothetical protein